MSWFDRVRLRSRALFRKDRFEAEMDEELRFHLDSQIEDNIKAGMSPEEARRTVLLSFGGVDKTKEECRETRATRLLDDLHQDLRYAVRVLRKSPGFTIVAVLMLALGIGANTAVVSVIDALVFRPLPFPQLDRLVSLKPGACLLNYLDIRADDQVFSGVAAYMGLPLMARIDNSAFLSGRAVSANFFQVLGLTMAAGRGFLPEEERLSGGPAVVIISHRLWQSSFGGDPAIAGKTLRLNGEPFIIVGVAPKNLRDVAFGGPHQDLWVPIPMFARVMHMEQEPFWREAIGRRDYDLWLTVIGRLKPGVTMEQASARLSVLIGNIRKAYPEVIKGWNPVLVSENRARWPEGNVLFASAVLMAAAICVLLITCTNIANLLLARGSTRQREIATRLAIGASRTRVARQLLAEALVLSALALVASFATCGLALRFLPAFERSYGTPLILDLPIDHRVLILAICISLVTILLFGLAPALVASRAELTTALRNQGFLNASRGGSRGRRVLVVFQVSLSAILLISGGLFIRMVRHFESIDPGFDRNILLLKSEFLSMRPEDQVKAMSFYRQSLERIRELPGVRSASWAGDPPFDRRGSIGERIRPDQADQSDAKWLSINCNVISPGYFQTLGIPILQGRDLTDRDWGNPGDVVIVNETLARRYWPGVVPLGKRIRVQGQDPELFEVIGIARDAKYRTLWEDRMPYAYFPFKNSFYFEQYLHVSALGDPRSLIDPIRRACTAVDPDARIDNGRLMSAQAESLLSQEHSVALVLGVFGTLALILAAVGLYGIISYSVAGRTHEFGIRMALGAENGDILRQVIMEGMALVLTGLAIALPCSMALSRFIASRLHGISPFDPLTYAAISVLCIVVAFLAVFLPARKATAHPMDALRSE